MQNSYRFFENKECQYYPCHKNMKAINCLFCYCPFYTKEQCPGNPLTAEQNGCSVRDCTNCIFPHQPENYDIIIEYLKSFKEWNEDK